MTLEHFNLPRQDWYDVISTDEKTGEIRGRIYKDRLIENFNAIENKLNEITRLQPYNTKYPDTSKFIYSDVTLDSDTNKVVNLKSFIDILGLKNTPLAVQFGEKRLIRLSYYDDNYKLRNINNVDLSNISNSKPFVIVDIPNQTVSASGDISEITGKTILGKWNGSTIDSCFDSYVANLNIYKMLMRSMLPYTVVTSKADIDNAPKQSNYSIIYYDRNKNNILGFVNKDACNGPLTITDYGTKYNKDAD